MNDLKMYRFFGWCGLALVILALAQFPLYMQGDASVSIYNGAALGRDLARIHNVVFARILLNIGVYVTAMVFAAGFSHLIRRARGVRMGGDAGLRSHGCMDRRDPRGQRT
jgi:hypothetical protein